MKKLQGILFMAVLLVFTSGCSLAYRVLLGVDTTPSFQSEQSINQRAKKLKIPASGHFTLDTASYFRDLKALYASTFQEMKEAGQDSAEIAKFKKAYSDDAQPTQFRLFDSAGSEIFKIVNCYLDPPIPINWNVKGSFDSFPPGIDEPFLHIHQFDLDFLIRHIATDRPEHMTMEDLPQAEYYGVVIWNDFYKRPSKRLIKTVKRYIRRTEAPVRLLYINNHNAYLWAIMDSESREKVKAQYAAQAFMQNECTPGSVAKYP